MEKNKTYNLKKTVIFFFTTQYKLIHGLLVQ